MPAVIEACTLVGIVLAFYKTFKVLRPSGAVDASPMLKFWILFGVLHFVGGLVSVYTRELKLVLMLCCFLPSSPGAIVPHVYEYTVAKLFALYGRTAEGWVRSAWRRFQTLLSYALRVTSRFVLQWTLPVVSERELAKLEASITDNRERLQEEHRRRRKAKLKSNYPRRQAGAGGSKVSDGKPCTDDVGEIRPSSPLGATEEAVYVSSSDNDSDSEFEGHDTFDDMPDLPLGSGVGNGAGAGATSFTPGPGLRHRSTRRQRATSRRYSSGAVLH